VYPFYIYLGLIGACLIAAIINKRVISDYAYPFILLLLAALLIEGTILTGRSKLIDFTHYFYSTIEVSMMCLIYINVLKGKKLKLFIKFFLVAQLLFFIFHTVKFGMYSNDSLFTLISHSFVLFLSLCYVFESFQPPFIGNKIFRQPFFWINSVHLLFYAGSFLHMTLMDRLEGISDSDETLLFNITKGFNYSLYSVYLIGISCQRIFK